MISHKTSARVALGELNMEPYGANSGTNIRHEVFEYLVKGFIPTSFISYMMFKSCIKIQNLRSDDP
jgi:hypothetical protein